MKSPYYGQRSFDRNKDSRRENEHRINWQIRVPNVRVFQDEKSLGVMPVEEARRMAQDLGLDLVEVAPEARPPVCKIMDYGKFKYEQDLKKKENAKKQRESQVQIKEIRLRPNIADHDITTRINQAKKFLESGCKVQFVLQFRGAREMCHKDQGFIVVKKFIENLNENSIVEKNPAMDGNKITFCLSPKV